MLPKKYSFELKSSRLSIFFTWFIFISCFTQLTGQTLYLYVGEMQWSTSFHLKTAAGKYTRKERTKLVSNTLPRFQSEALENLLKSLLPGDALALILYKRDYNLALENRLKNIKPLLKKQKIHLGLWLLKEETVPPVLKSMIGQNFDAVSSASEEISAKKMAKKFFLKLLVN